MLKVKKIPIRLKVKSLIYKYLGIYLANSEELEYLTSKEFWKSFSKMLSHPKNDMSARNIQGLLIGLWQARHGFARPVSFLRYKRPRAFYKIVAWFAELYTTLKWDIESISSKFHNSLKNR